MKLKTYTAEIMTRKYGRLEIEWDGSELVLRGLTKATQQQLLRDLEGEGTLVSMETDR